MGNKFILKSLLVLNGFGLLTKGGKSEKGIIEICKMLLIRNDSY